jgi:hypothetical protein
MNLILSVTACKTVIEISTQKENYKNELKDIEIYLASKRIEMDPKARTAV